MPLILQVDNIKIERTIVDWIVRSKSHECLFEKMHTIHSFKSILIIMFWKQTEACPNDIVQAHVLLCIPYMRSIEIKSHTTRTSPFIAGCHLSQ